MPSEQKICSLRIRILEIIEVGAPDGLVSRAYDIVDMLSIVVNLTVSVMFTFKEIRETHGPLLF